MKNVDYKNAIRKSLSKIGFDDYLQSSYRSCLNPAISTGYFIELAIFAHFESNLLMLSSDYTSKSSGSCVVDTLSGLHLIQIVKYMHDSSNNLALCDLTLLGKDFINNYTNLPHVTGLAYKQYHHQVVQNNYYLDNNDADSDNYYSRLCNFVCSHAFNNLVRPYQSLIRRNDLLDFILKHLDYYQNLFSDRLARRPLFLALNKSMFYNLH